MRAWLEPEPHEWWHVVDEAMAEDLGHGDLTSACLPPDQMVNWYIEAQSDCVVCGVGICQHLFAPFGEDPESATFTALASDGSWVKRGERIAEGHQLARRVMSSERTALNFVMLLSGVATLTSSFVSRVNGTHAKITDTRKTVPGLRALQKYAVRCGGGHNHRMGLYDAAMIKDNHIAACGGIKPAMDTLKRVASHMTKIEVEASSMEEVAEAVEAGADVVLLDNMDPFMMREAVQKFSGRCLFEASGGMSLETVKGVAQTGVDYISVGALTHSAVAVPFHLEIE